MTRSASYLGGKGIQSIVTLTISLGDLLTLQAGLRAADQALEDWEFEVLMGVTRPNAREVLGFLSRECDRMKVAVQAPDLGSHRGPTSAGDETYRSARYRGGKGLQAIVTVTMSLEDLFTVFGGLREAIEALQGEEFDAKMGITRAHAIELLHFLVGEYNRITATAQD